MSHDDFKEMLRRPIRFQSNHEPCLLAINLKALCR